jgi:hypothetical protein
MSLVCLFVLTSVTNRVFPLDEVAHVSKLFFPRDSTCYTKTSGSAMRPLPGISTTQHFRFRYLVDTTGKGDPVKRVMIERRNYCDEDWSLPTPIFWNNECGLSHANIGPSLTRSVKDMAELAEKVCVYMYTPI